MEYIIGWANVEDKEWILNHYKIIHYQILYNGVVDLMYYLRDRDNFISGYINISDVIDNVRSMIDPNDPHNVIHYNNFLTLIGEYQDVLIEERAKKINQILK